MTIISNNIKQATELLEKGKLLAIPTETVYGLAANIFDKNAVEGIFKLKKRPLFNPLIVHIHSMKQLEELSIEIPEKARILANLFWPGELTLVLKKSSTIPDLVTAGKDTVALRMPKHNLLRELLQNIDFPIAAPSANPFGSISPTNANRVKDYFEGELEMVLDGGECESGIESTIIGFDNGEAVLYRLGSLALEDIEKAIGKVSLRTKNDHNPQAPGMLSKHYSPYTPFVLSDNIEEDIQLNEAKKLGILSFIREFKHPSVKANKVLTSKGDYKEASSNFYEALHQLDQMDLDLIIGELLPEEELGKSINDRLRRAAAQNS